MSQVMKAFTGVFMVLFLMVTSAGVIGAFGQILHAQNTHACMIDELENSDYARHVLESCFKTAAEENYQLQLSLYSDTEEMVTCMDVSGLPEDTDFVSMAEVVLDYSIEIAFFEIDVKQQLFGYAR